MAAFENDPRFMNLRSNIQSLLGQTTTSKNLKSMSSSQLQADEIRRKFENRRIVDREGRGVGGGSRRQSQSVIGTATQTQAVGEFR